MSGADEFASNSVKSFDWRRLPEGNWEIKNGEIVRVDDSEDAADRVSLALRKFAVALEQT